MTAILFDLDGVILDSREAITTSLDHALAAHDVPEPPAAELHRFIGPALADAFAELLSESRESELVVGCVTAYRAHYPDESLRSTILVPGIAEVIEDLARTHQLAIASSKPVAFSEPILEQFGLRHHFETVAGPDLNPFGETKAATIATALETVGRPAVMVGDRRHDIEGALANGIPCIGVLWGIGSEAELRGAGAAALVDRPADVPDAIDRMTT
jgi:phosphoglycolate phosphatase